MQISTPNATVYAADIALGRRRVAPQRVAGHTELTSRSAGSARWGSRPTARPPS